LQSEVTSPNLLAVSHRAKPLQVSSSTESYVPSPPAPTPKDPTNGHDSETASKLGLVTSLCDSSSKTSSSGLDSMAFVIAGTGNCFSTESGDISYVVTTRETCPDSKSYDAASNVGSISEEEVDVWQTMEYMNHLKQVVIQQKKNYHLLKKLLLMNFLKNKKKI
jgi:hypothetical protein